MARRRDDELLSDALRLPIKQRARVAQELMASLDVAEPLGKSWLVQQGITSMWVCTTSS
jgi:hypothetical protein